MPDIIAYDEWISRTYHKVYRRSTELKALDEAIKRYHEHKSFRADSTFLRDDFKEELRHIDLKAVDQTFGVWRTSKGLSYRTSARNKKGAIDELEQQLRAERQFSQGELDAFRAMDQMREKSLQTIFGETRLEWKSLIKKRRLDLGSVTSNLGTIAFQANQIDNIARGTANTSTVLTRNAALRRSTASLGTDLLKGAFGVNSLSDLGPVIGQIVGDWLKDFVAAVTPWIGIVASGSKAIVYAGLAARDKYAKCTLVEQRTFMRSGDPSLAADGLNELITRNMNLNLRTAGRATAEFGGKLTSAFVDGGAAIGPAIGAASATAGLIDTFFMIGRQWQEKKKVNMLLEDPDQIDSDIFAKCPLLGAFYLSTASDYEIMMILVEDFGRSHWMDDIQKVKSTHIAPLQALASSYVFNSRFGLVDKDGHLLSYKGTIPQGAIDKLRKKMGLWK